MPKFTDEATQTEAAEIHPVGFGAHLKALQAPSFSFPIDFRFGNRGIREIWVCNPPPAPEQSGVIHRVTSPSEKSDVQSTLGEAQLAELEAQRTGESETKQHEAPPPKRPPPSKFSTEPIHSTHSLPTGSVTSWTRGNCGTGELLQEWSTCKELLQEWSTCRIESLPTQPIQQASQPTPSPAGSSTDLITPATNTGASKQQHRSGHRTPESFAYPSLAETANPADADSAHSHF